MTLAGRMTRVGKMQNPAATALMSCPAQGQQSQKTERGKLDRPRVGCRQQRARPPSRRRAIRGVDPGARIVLRPVIHTVGQVCMHENLNLRHVPVLQRHPLILRTRVTGTAMQNPFQQCGIEQYQRVSSTPGRGPAKLVKILDSLSGAFATFGLAVDPSRARFCAALSRVSSPSDLIRGSSAGLRQSGKRSSGRGPRMTSVDIELSFLFFVILGFDPRIHSGARFMKSARVPQAAG